MTTVYTNASGVVTMNDMARLMEKVFEECRALRAAGQKEYAHEESNALANFERLAHDLHMRREQILWVFTRKHLDGILAYINGHKSQREGVEGRINDVIVYLVLLRAMVQQERENTFDHA